MDQHLQPRLTVDGVALASRRLAWLGALVGIAGGLACGVGYKPAITVEALAESRSPAKHLVRYLQLTSADPAACDPMRSDGPAVRFVDRAVLRRLNDAFAQGLIPLERWQACVLYMWTGADPVVERLLHRALLVQLRDVVLHPDLASDRQLRARAYAVVRVAQRRQSTTVLDPAEVLELRTLVAARRDQLREQAHSARAVEVLRRVGDALDQEVGEVDGEALTVERVESSVDERLLLGWARRSPDAALREAAQRRLVQRRIQTSAFASVRDEPIEVLRRMAEHGYNPVPVDAVVRSTSWSPGPDDAVMLRLLQDYKKGWAKLLPSAVDETRTPDASVDLRGSLSIVVQGLQEPIGLCPAADRWDPTPCWPANRLSMTHPVAALAPTGRVRFDRDLALDDVLRLGSDGDRLSAQIIVGEVAQNIDLPIFFDSVPEMVVVGYGSTVAHLKVNVWELSNQRLLIEATPNGGGRAWRALVAMNDSAFGIVSYGDMNGPGGNVDVRVECTRCDEVRAWLQARCRSVGGHDAPAGEVSIRVHRSFDPP